MAKNKSAIGLSALLLGFSVGSLGETGSNEIDKILKYAPPIKEEAAGDQKITEGASLDLKSTDIEASLWDNASDFLNDKNNGEEDSVIYASPTNPEDNNESYTEIMNGLLSEIDMDD